MSFFPWIGAGSHCILHGILLLWSWFSVLSFVKFGCLLAGLVCFILYHRALTMYTSLCWWASAVQICHSYALCVRCSLRSGIWVNTVQSWLPLSDHCPSFFSHSIAWASFLCLPLLCTCVPEWLLEEANSSPETMDPTLVAYSMKPSSGNGPGGDWTDS